MAARHAQPRARKRLSARSKAVSGLAVTTLVGTALWAWPASGNDHDGRADAKNGAPRAAAASERSAARSGRSAPDTPRADRPIPHLSDAVRKQIPADSRQVLVVTGKSRDSSESQVVLYTRAKGSRSWHPGPTWPAHNAAHGWTERHHYGDLRSPEGVFTLTDAGGRLPAPPGTKLPYTHSGSFVANGTGVEGEPLEGAFDYVMAINYNRVPGTSPLDQQRPLGAERGGGVWLHVDHDGPTQGCVSLKPEVMKELLRTLDPAQHPVIVMGPAGR
ncbi:L,D-transpeptidase family protein [Streptomyces halobius]|uniref:L,D-transpeptidase family protein n=1 Tax=Streptomyces halobius TaxID=2879846 RepID=A0ABY4MAR0_9ACTN|nr:L,D-transpeptidase family protein [Streptomyces halobius]UQA94869.1 L,D-transpeptidase family protein [Streptomyces halobius]